MGKGYNHVAPCGTLNGTLYVEHCNNGCLSGTLILEQQLEQAWNICNVILETPFHHIIKIKFDFVATLTGKVSNRLSSNLANTVI